MNRCRACREDFASISAFDDHRVGRHEHLYSEAHPDGRRCLTPAELEALGMRKDARGRWRLPVRGTQPWTSDVNAQNGRAPTNGRQVHRESRARRGDTSPRGSK
jgi:hypothetical protein